MILLEFPNKLLISLDELSLRGKALNHASRKFQIVIRGVKFMCNFHHAGIILSTFCSVKV